MRTRLLSILPSEENREPLLMGKANDFINDKGDIVVRRVFKGLEESEKAVTNRCQKLKYRLKTPDLTNEIMRKVQNPC